MKNNFRIEGDIIFVDLQHKGIPLTMLVDLEDLGKLESYPNTVYAKYDKTIDGYYAIGKLNQKPFIFHRYLMDFPEGKTVDHQNHSTLDNRRSCNLRAVSQKINSLNRKGASSASKTGIRNLYFCNTSNRFIVEIGSHKRKFKTIELAKEHLKEVKS